MINNMWYKSIMDAYPILYRGKNKPDTKSLMCYGFGCGKGWERPLAKLSFLLEQQNILNKKDRLVIEAAQVKEKYGTLRYYYDIYIDDPLWQKILCWPFSSIENIINNNIQFKYKTVIDRPSYHEERWNKITKNEYNEKIIPKYAANQYGWKFKKEGKQYFRNCDVVICAKQHREVCNFKFLKYIANICKKLSSLWYFYTPSEKLMQKRHSLTELVDTYIATAEKECTQLCEECGTQIGTSYSPTCCTTGWIRYLCKSCAEKTDHIYIINNKKYCKGKLIKNETNT